MTHHDHESIHEFNSWPIGLVDSLGLKIFSDFLKKIRKIFYSSNSLNTIDKLISQ